MICAQATRPWWPSAAGRHSNTAHRNDAWNSLEEIFLVRVPGLHGGARGASGARATRGVQRQLTDVLAQTVAGCLMYAPVSVVRPMRGWMTHANMREPDLMSTSFPRATGLTA